MTAKEYGDNLNFIHCLVQELINGNPLDEEEIDRIFYHLEESREFFYKRSQGLTMNPVEETKVKMPKDFFKWLEVCPVPWSKLKTTQSTIEYEFEATSSGWLQTWKRKYFINRKKLKGGV